MAAFGFEMAPGNQVMELAVLQRRLAELEEDLQRARSARTAADLRFRRFLDASPALIWMTGPDGLHNYFNPAWLDFRGRTEEEEIGNGWVAGLNPDDRELCLETWLKSFGSRQPFRMQFRMRTAAGAYCWLENAGVPLSDESGDFTGFIGCAADISGRKSGYFTPDEHSVRMVFSLTERERQVLMLIADGKSTKQAAVRLGISYKTADSHRSRILEKLGIHETASMVRYAIRAGLVAP